MKRPLLQILAVGAASLLPAWALHADPVAQVVGVSQEATITAGGQSRTAQEGMTVALGDEVSTGSGGGVQLQFVDDTRMAVGAGSTLVIEEVLFDASGSSSNFVVEAVSGAFRFLSGRSSNEAYSVNTPTATMGIRGTTFDFSVGPERGVDLATLEGEVLLCGDDGRCARASGGCAVVSLSSAGEFEIPATQAEKRDLLRAHFPFIVDQRGLRRELRAAVASCGDLTRQHGDGAAPSAPTTPSTPDAPDRGGSGGAQAGNGAASSGGGGSTAGGTSAGDGGPGSGPGDADAGGGGASAGGASAGGGGASAGGN